MFSRARALRVYLFSASLLPALGVPAQTHRVEKPERVTRAIGVYEWTGELDKPTASRLVPVSLFIEGHLEDAGVYLARPVPFALSPGYIYAVEKAGDPLGTVDLSEARSVATRRAADDDNPVSAWFGYGRYIPPAAAAKPPVLHASAHPGTIVASSSGNRPSFSNRSADATPPDKEKAPETPAQQAGAPSPAKPAETVPSSPASEDSDRPHMSRRADTSASSTTDDPTTSVPKPGPTAGEDDPERPSLRRRDAKAEPKRHKESGSGVRPMATSLNDDPDRPTLRHGAEDTPVATPPLSGNPPDLHQAVAVSDATTVENHAFARAWESATERASMLAAFQALARPRVANYLALNQLRPGVTSAQVSTPARTGTEAAGNKVAKPSGSGEDTGGPPRLQRGRPSQGTSPAAAAPLKTVPPALASATPTTPAKVPAHAATRVSAASRAKRSANSAASPMLLQDEQLTGFTLSYGGLPTYVYTAVTPTGEGAPVHITLVAQQLPSGELQVALSSVTDEAHLDRSPWMRLVDVVDPNVSHRASLLFELRAKASRQFALYSLLSARAEQNFVTGLMQ